MIEQRDRHGPGLGLDIAGGHVQPDAESQLPAFRRGQAADPGQLLRHLGRRLLVELAREVERLTGPGAPHDGQELSRPGVPLVVRQVVAEPALLGGLASGHHVEQQPAARRPRTRCRSG